MNRIVNDASRRVAELKRQQTFVDDEIEMQSFCDGGTKSKNYQDDLSRQVDLSSIGEALEWSPKRTPKK